MNTYLIQNASSSPEKREMKKTATHITAPDNMIHKEKSGTMLSINKPFRYFSLTTIMMCIFCITFGCRSYNYSNIINKSQNVALDNYLHDVSEWLDVYSTERGYDQTQVLLDSAIELMTEEKITDTIFVFETYGPTSKVYCMYLWNNNKSCCINHTFDSFYLDTTSTIDYRLKDLISKWDTDEITKVSHLKGIHYYQKWPMFNCATRLVIRFQKQVAAETIIIREMDFDTDTYPTFFD